MTQLSHPNIVKLHEVFDNEEYTHIVMDHFKGDTLSNYIARNGPLSEREAKKVMKQLVSAVSYMHEQKTFHRDLKCENILLTTPNSLNHIKLIDFGLAGNIRSSHMYTALAGSLIYMAPEVISGYYDYHCDIWSLGVILHYLLVGYPPFVGPTEEKTSKRI